MAAHDEWSPDVEREPNGERLVWIEDLWANRLAAMRGPGESYSVVILRLVEIEAKGGP